MSSNLKEMLKAIRNKLEFYFANNHFKKKGTNNTIDFGKNNRYRSCRIEIIGNNNRIKIGNNGNLKGMSILVVGNNNYVELGNNVWINATTKRPACINCGHGSKVIFGNYSGLSNNTELHTTDYHPIYDCDHNRINPEQDIIIGDNVWVGIRSLILKGTELQDGTIVGAGSIVTRKFDEKQVIIAGNPAKIIKRGVTFDFYERLADENKTKSK